MKRTRKWEYVKQEATRLAELGLGSAEIALRIQVDTATVNRWFKAGKLARREPVRQGSAAVADTRRKSPAEWAASVRDDYSLSDTDDQLVTMAEEALATALSKTEGISSRLTAMRTFQGLVRQLALVAKVVEVPEDEPAPEPKPAPRVLRPTGTDPRIALMVVK